MRTTRWHRGGTITTSTLLSGALALVVLAACSADASTRAGGADDGDTTTTAEQVELADEIPAGTTLRVGDQVEYLETILRLAGEDQELPYTVEYSAFVGGPAMLQAFQGDSVDVGFVASTPLIFAQAQGQDIAAVAGWASETGSTSLVTAPGQDDIGGWEDIAGKRVAYQRGTSGEATVLQALDAAGLTLDDIETVDLPFNQVSAALQGGSADAGILAEPLISVYLDANPTAHVAAPTSEITDRATFLIASGTTLDDEAKTAALADYLSRLARAFSYLADHRELVQQATYVDTYGLSPERAAEISEAVGPTEFIDLAGEVVEQQQVLAGLFQAAGQIPTELDVTTEFDTRFSSVIEEAAGS